MNQMFIQSEEEDNTTIINLYNIGAVTVSHFSIKFYSPGGVGARWPWNYGSTAARDRGYNKIIRKLGLMVDEVKL